MMARRLRLPDANPNPKPEVPLNQTLNCVCSKIRRPCLLNPNPYYTYTDQAEAGVETVETASPKRPKQTLLADLPYTPKLKPIN